MNRILSIIMFVGVLTFATQNEAKGQAEQQLNFGIIGVSYEIPVASAITVAPTAFTNLDFSYLTLGAKANYYFDDLFELNSDWDVYAGANAGFGVGVGNSHNSSFAVGAQVGGRWFWSDTWGVYVEIGGGNLGGNGGVGVTMKM